MEHASKDLECPSDAPSSLPPEDLVLQVLTQDQIKLIDDALAALGPFGEVRLIKEKGRLRFIQMLESKSAI